MGSMSLAIALGLAAYVLIAALFLLNCVLDSTRPPSFAGFAGLLLLSALWPLVFASMAVFLVMSRAGARAHAQRRPTASSSS